MHVQLAFLVHCDARIERLSCTKQRPPTKFSMFTNLLSWGLNEPIGQLTRKERRTSFKIKFAGLLDSIQCERKKKKHFFFVKIAQFFCCGLWLNSLFG